MVFDDLKRRVAAEEYRWYTSHFEPLLKSLDSGAVEDSLQQVESEYVALEKKLRKRRLGTVGRTVMPNGQGNTVTPAPKDTDVQVKRDPDGQPSYQSVVDEAQVTQGEAREPGERNKETGDSLEERKESESSGEEDTSPEPSKRSLTPAWLLTSNKFLERYQDTFCKGKLDAHKYKRLIALNSTRTQIYTHFKTELLMYTPSLLPKIDRESLLAHIAQCEFGIDDTRQYYSCRCGGGMGQVTRLKKKIEACWWVLDLLPGPGKDEDQRVLGRLREKMRQEILDE